MCDMPLLAFGALVIKSTAMLPATAFFGAKVAPHGYSQGIAKSLEEICADGKVVLSSLC